MSKKKEFLNHWLDCVVEGQPIREWCQWIQGETERAHCTYCNVDMTFSVNGLKTFRRHAASIKHRENRKTAQLHPKEPPDSPRKQLNRQETIDVLSGLYPGMNFDCFVDLLPLSVLYKASQHMKSSDLALLLRRLVKSEANKTFIDVYICFFCGEEFKTRPNLQSHQRECGIKLPVVSLEKTDVIQQDNFATPSLPSFLSQSSGGATTREQMIYPYITSSKDRYISALGLLPKKKAARVCNRRRNTECETIDLDEDIPISPSFPRTPKLLISHLSREGSENCVDNTSPGRVRRTLFSLQHSRTDKETIDRTGENDEISNEENKSEKSKISHAKSLYSLDLTSPLGQFVIKHIKGDPNLHVLSDVESHCLTSPPKKSSPAIQLRERHITYPVTFKGFLGKMRSSHEHQYKFTHRQTVEFLRRVNTGLDRRSRVLLRKMIPCKVRLTHITKADLKKWMVSKQEVTVDLKPLSAEEITYWTSPKEVDTNSNTSAVFPSGLTFSSPNVNNVLGLKTCQEAPFCKRYNLSMVNFVSEETFAEVTENRRAVYKSLLSDSTSSGSSSSETENPSAPVIRQILSSPSLNTSSQRRDQTIFGNISPTINMTKNNVVSSLSTIPCSQMDKYSNKEANKNCSFLSSVNRCISYPSSALIDSYASLSVKLSNISGGGSVTKEDKTGELNNGPLRSGIYNIQIRTALEGQFIKSSVKKILTVSYIDRESLRRNGTLKESSAGGRKIVDSSSFLKSFKSSKRAHSPDVLKKHHLKNSRLKKRKVDTELSVPYKNVSMTSQKNAPVVSLLKSSESGSKHSPTKVKMTRDTKSVEAALQRLSMDSLCSAPEKEQSTSQVKKDCALNGLEPGDKSTLVKGVSLHGRRGEHYKSVGFYRKLATIGTSRNSNVDRLSSHLLAQRNTHSDIFVNVKEQEEQLKVVTDESSMSSSDLEVVSNGGNRKSSVCNSSVVSKAKLISHIYNSEKMTETRNIEYKSAIDSSSKKSVKVVQNSSPQSNNSSESMLNSQKDSFSPGLKFVTYSSPVSPPVSPQLRQSSLINTISVPRRAEVRKSLLSNFLLKPNGKPLGISLIREPSSTEQTKSAKDKFRYTSRGKEGK